MDAYLLYIILDLRIPQSNSLKSKRKIIKSLKDRIRARFNVSVAEISHLDKWQRTTIALAMVSGDKVKLVKDQTAIEVLVKEITEVELIDIKMEWL